MRDYIRGLLGPVGRKNGWQLAEYAGRRTPDRLQRLLNGARWDADEIRDDLQHYVAERLGEPDGILILDDTGFLKKGTISAGVQRRYSGTAGRTENCRIGVFAAYATTRGRALVDHELYLPKSWTDDRDRCRAAHIPDERTFATKPDLAKTMVLRAIASPLPIAWVTADSAYGQERRLRRMLEETGLGYVLAVPQSQQVPHFGRIDHLFSQAPDEAWERRSCGDGAKGPRVYRWAALQIASIEDFDGELPTHQRWALARRSISKPPGDRLLPRLRTARHHGRAPGPRRRNALGHRGSFPGRQERVRPRPVRSPPLHRLDAARHSGHAGARLPGGHGRRRRGKRGSRNGSCLVPLTVAEVRRLLATGHPPATHAHQSLTRARALRWSQWRRRRQAVACRCHYRRRLHTIEGRSGPRHARSSPRRIATCESEQPSPA